MFETSVVLSRVAAERRVGLLTASLALHTFAAVAVIVAGIRSLEFPAQAPDQFQVVDFAPAPVIPPPRGNPDAPRAAQPPAPAPVQRAVTPAAPANAAPQIIPDTLPTAGPVESSGPAIGDATTTGDGSRWGTPHGDPNAIDVGQPAQPVSEGPLVIEGDVRAPVVIRRVEPVYPRAALLARKSGSVTVLCVIDKNGKVRESQVTRSTFALFDQSAIDAVRQWQFLPGSLHGKPVDTWFELTVTFVAR